MMRRLGCRRSSRSSSRSTASASRCTATRSGSSLREASHRTTLSNAAMRALAYISWRKPDPSEAPQPQARYACVDSDTNPNDVFKLLNECWKLKRPSVLISVTGSAQDIDLEPRLATEFEKDCPWRHPVLRDGL